MIAKKINLQAIVIGHQIEAISTTVKQCAFGLPWGLFAERPEPHAQLRRHRTALPKPQPMQRNSKIGVPIFTSGAHSLARTLNNTVVSPSCGQTRRA